MLVFACAANHGWLVEPGVCSHGAQRSEKVYKQAQVVSRAAPAAKHSAQAVTRGIRRGRY